MRDLTDHLDEIERIVEDIQQLDEPTRARVSQLLDGIDVLHRFALKHLATVVGDDTLRQAGGRDPVVAWLLDAYGIAVDERAVAGRVLEDVRPDVESQGGRLELVDVRDGVVKVRMAGACAGCSGSAVALRAGVEQALRDEWPGFMRLETEDDPGPAVSASPQVIPQIHRRGRHTADGGR